MKRTTTVVLTLLFAFMIGSSTVLAQNAHFVREVRARDLGTQLQVSGSIAGLGNQDVDVIVVAEGIASIECTNPGGNVAPGQDTELVLTGEQLSLEPKNGRVNFTVVTEEPVAPDEACPNPQWTPEVTDVEFTSYTITVIQPSGSGNVVLEETFEF
jgi:hypothetical protein